MCLIWIRHQRKETNKSYVLVFHFLLLWLSTETLSCASLEPPSSAKGSPASDVLLATPLAVFQLPLHGRLQNRYAVALHGPKNPAINVWYQGPPKAMQSSGWFEIVHGGLQLGTIKLRCTECYIYDCLKMTHGCIVKKREDKSSFFLTQIIL